MFYQNYFKVFSSLFTIALILMLASGCGKKGSLIIEERNLPNNNPFDRQIINEKLDKKKNNGFFLDKLLL